MVVHAYSYQLVDPPQMESRIQFIQHVIVPHIQHQRGFKGFQALVHRQSGKCIGMTYWQSEADARAAAEVDPNPQLAPPGAEPPPIRDILVEMYEVAIDVPAK